MGGVVGSLFMLWVRSGFSSASVASALTFFPPQPTYKVEKDESAQEAYKVTHYIQENRKYSDAAKVVMVHTKLGNDLPCFVFKHPEAKYTMIFSHGNATDCGAMYLRYLSLSKELKINVVGYDYSGYGSATGTPSEANTYADINAVFDFVSQSLCNDPSREILVYGQSVGSGPSIFLASEKNVRGLIIHSGLLSGMRVLTSNRSLGCLDIYPNINRIKHVHCPTLIIHGMEDSEIDISHGHELFNALPEESKVVPYWVEQRGHNDIGETPECRPAYIQRLREYIQGLN